MAPFYAYWLYRRRMRLGWIAAALLVTLTACGGDAKPDPAVEATTSTSPTASESETEASAQTDEEALEAAYRTYVDAFLTGDGATAYGLLTDRCREGTPLSEFAAISESAAELYGKVDYTVNSVTVDGDEGTIDATYAVDALNEGGGSVWIREAGEWRSDKCS